MTVTTVLTMVLFAPVYEPGSGCCWRQYWWSECHYPVRED